MGSRHRAVLKCDSQWMSDIITRLEAQQELRGRLDVMFSNLAGRRGSRLELRAPMTETDALGHLLGQLHTAGASTIRGLVPLLVGLNAVHRDLLRHDVQSICGQTVSRARLSASMRRLAVGGRPPLCADMLLDCTVRLPTSVASDLAAAASVLTRLSPNPPGPPEWAGFHELFAERYGVGALVPLLDVLDPGTGLGFPAGYPGSVLPAPPAVTGPRDARLAAMAWRAVARGEPEIELTDQMIGMVTAGDTFDPRYIQPHVELAASVRAANKDALDHGDYTLAVAPARAAGTLTSRFSPIAAGSGLEDVYRHVPTLHAGALPVQLSFPPLYPRGENVARMPPFLEHVLPLGEHRPPGGAGTIIGLDELAVAATRRGLVLVWLNTGQVIEPQVFHALALQKQVPALARFLANLPRAFAADYLAFDWGACARLMPYLPQLRYGRTILSPARWRLTTADLPDPRATSAQWHHALGSWQADMRCPDHVELHDGDLTLRLDLRVPAHVASLRDHLARRDIAILTPACDPALLGWLNGHCHEVAVPLVRLGPPSPGQIPQPRPLLIGRRHGDFPAGPAAGWLTAKLFAHPDCLHEIITSQLLDQHIVSLTTARLTQARRCISRGQAPQPAEYDLIGGLTGLGIYHLSRHSTAAPTTRVLQYLVALTLPLHRTGRALPGWWCSAGPSGRLDHHWAGGHANLGMAHGIAVI